LTQLAARCLEPEESAAILGDLTEAADSGFHALCQVLGLVVRRQFSIWRDWRPWLGLIGIAGVSAYILGGLLQQFDMTFYMRMIGYLSHQMYYNFRTDNQEIAYLVSLAFAISMWSWLSAFALTLLSRRAAWLNGTLFYLVVLNSIWVRHFFGDGQFSATHSLLFILRSMLPARVGVLLLFTVPAILGVWQARKNTRLRISQSVAVGILLLLATVLLTWTSGFYGANREAMSHGTYHAAAWYSRMAFFILLSWPMIYLIASPARTRQLATK
jgi:hypothetical protein